MIEKIFFASPVFNEFFVSACTCIVLVGVGAACVSSCETLAEWEVLSVWETDGPPLPVWRAEVGGAVDPLPV